MENLPAKTYCNHIALQKGLDPGGSALPFDTLLLLEVPLPWKGTLQSMTGQLPQELFDLVALQMEHYQETGVWPPIHALLIAPDEAYANPGWRRVIHFQRDGAQISWFARREYFVPEAQLGPLVWALTEAPDRLTRFEQWRLRQSGITRDLLVCTHGSVDAACAKFGYPLYRYLRDEHAAENRRVWRVSHFGGHVFAPTLLDMPTGRFWGYVAEAQAGQIAQQSGAVADLKGYYRGWAGLENGFLQTAERAIWQREGWGWFDKAIRGEIVAQDEADPPAWAEVVIEARGKVEQVTYRASVELVRHVHTIHTTGNEAKYPYPQYAVRWLKKLITSNHKQLEVI